MEHIRDITVLITAAGNVFMPGITACIKNNGERNIRLIGADMNDDPSLLQMCDAYYPVPRGDDPSYIEALLEICRKEQADILLPIMTVELNALADNRDRFERIGTKVGISDRKALRIANDKINLFNYLREQGIPCADFVSVHSFSELESAVRMLGYPKKRVCIKTTDGSGSRGFRILDENGMHFDSYLHDKPSSSCISYSLMKDILSKAPVFPKLMVMEYLPGAEYTVDLLADHGQVLYNCCRKSLRMDNGIMLDSEVVINEAAATLCRRVVESLGLDGNLGFDILARGDGTPLIVECNPRITAGISVFRLAGINLPYLNIKRLLGEKLPPCELKIGTVVKRRWMEM